MTYGHIANCALVRKVGPSDLNVVSPWGLLWTQLTWDVVKYQLEDWAHWGAVSVPEVVDVGADEDCPPDCKSLLAGRESGTATDMLISKQNGAPGRIELCHNWSVLTGAFGP